MLFRLFLCLLHSNQRNYLIKQKNLIMDRNSKVINQNPKQYLCSQKNLRSVLSDLFLLQEVKDKYSAVVKMNDSGDKLKLDQTHLETVIPAPGGPPSPLPVLPPAWLTPSKLLSPAPAGKRVLILNGPYREVEALLEGIDEKSFSATLTLDSVSLRPGLILFALSPPLLASIKFRRLSFQGQQKGRRVNVAYEDFSKLA